ADRRTASRPRDAWFRLLVGSACGSIERFPCGFRASASTTPGDERPSFSGWGVTATAGRDEVQVVAVQDACAPTRAWGKAAGALLGDDVDGERDLDVGGQRHRDLGFAQLLQRGGEPGPAAGALRTPLGGPPPPRPPPPPPPPHT